MRTIKLLVALILFAVATVLFLQLVDSITLGSSLIIVGALALTGLILSFVGLPGRRSPTPHRGAPLQEQHPRPR